MANILSEIGTSLALGGFRSTRDEFYELMAKAIDNRENIKEFLQAELAISCNPKTRDSSRAAAFRAMLKQIGESDEHTFLGFLGPFVPMSDRIMLAAVDESRDRAETLRALAVAVREQRVAKAMLTKSLTPPLMLVPGLGAFAYVIAAKSIPVIAKIAPPEVWTPFNSLVRSVAEFIVDWGLPLAVAIVIALTVFMYLLPRATHPWRYAMERLDQSVALLLLPVAPWILPMALYRDFQVSLMLNALAVLLRSGSTLKDALETVRMASSPWMKVHIRRVMQHLEDHPTEYVEAFSRGLLTPRMLAKLASTLRTTQFDQVLIQVGTSGSAAMRGEIEKSTKVLNGILLGAAGALLAFLYLGNGSISQSMSEEMDPSKQMQNTKR